jgi:hypothetical protein
MNGPEVATTATLSEVSVGQQLADSQLALRRALRRSAAGKGREWAAAVSEDLTEMLDLLVRHREEVRGPHCHYEKLCLEAQWMIPRIQKLIASFDEVEFEAGLLQQRLAEVVRGETQLVGEARNDALHLLARLRRTLTEESYVEVDRFNEPPALD